MDFKELYQGLKSSIGDKITSFKNDHRDGLSKIKQSAYIVEAFFLGTLPFTVQGENYTGKNNKNNHQTEWVYKGPAKTISNSNPNTRDLETELMGADSTIAYSNAIPYPEFHKEHIFMNTATGDIENIWMAVLATNDTAQGGDLSGYSWTKYLEAGEQEILESTTNSCFDIVDIDTVQDVDTYTTDMTNHWIDCGYITTSTEGSNSSESSTTNRLLAYPVPFQNGFTIKPKEEISTIQIHNLNGQKVYENLDKVDANKTLFLQPEIKNGMYILSATTNQGETLVTKVIKQ